MCGFSDSSNNHFHRKALKCNICFEWEILKCQEDFIAWYDRGYDSSYSPVYLRVVYVCSFNIISWIWLRCKVSSYSLKLYIMAMKSLTSPKKCKEEMDSVHTNNSFLIWCICKEFYEPLCNHLLSSWLWITVHY